MVEDGDQLRDVYLGRVLDHRYRLTRRLGAGGMGVVYEAEHEQIGRRIAIKILHPQYAADFDVMRRFKNEARASGTLGHPHIVQALDFGRTDEGAPYIAMELLEGRDLGAAIAQDGPFRIDRAIAIADQIADALGAAHEKGIVHRDVKPENVFLSGGDVVKILDFGISKFIEGDARVATQTGAIMGSPHYMAPEQTRDSSRADARTDVYSLGAVLYTMLSGRTVFPDTSLPALIVAIAIDPPRPLSEVREDAPAALDALVMRLLAKEPDQRPQSMMALRALLAAFADIDAAPRVSMPIPRAAPTQTTPFVREVSTSRVELPIKSGSTALLVGGVVLALVAVAGVGLIGTDGAPEPTPTPPVPVSGPDEAPSAVVAGDAATADAGAPDAARGGRDETRRPDARATRRDRPVMMLEMAVEPNTVAAPVMIEHEPPAMVEPPVMSSVMTTARIDGVPIDDTY